MLFSNPKYHEAILRINDCKFNNYLNYPNCQIIMKVAQTDLKNKNK